METKHVAHKLYNLFKFLWNNGMYWIIFLWWSSLYSRYTRNKIYLRHRVLLLVDIIWKGVISHNTTNFQGRRNFSFTSVADPGEGPAPPLLFLDQSEARKVEKSFLETRPPPPYLREGLDDRSPLISRSVSGTALVSQVSRAGLNNYADGCAWTSLKLSTLVLTGLPTMFALFLKFGAERFPRISDLFSSRKTGLKFLIWTQG